MGKRYLRSDLSEEEAYFVTQGLVLIGTSNPITALFRFVGKYEELKDDNNEKEIVNYRPQNDIHFKSENAGYTIIKREIEKKFGHSISRKHIKNISRKWSPSRVLLSFNTPEIISMLFSYIMDRDTLRIACVNHFSYNRNNWHNIMPIQFEFLGVRLRDHHKNWQSAERIINCILEQDLH